MGILVDNYKHMTSQLFNRELFICLNKKYIFD